MPAGASASRGMTLGAGRAAVSGSFTNLQRARTMRQAAQEAALLEPGDQAMDARLGLQPQRFLHLVEGGRHAIVVEPLVDEQEQFVLLAG